MRRNIVIGLLAVSVVCLAGCSVYKTLVNVSRLKFKLGTVNKVQLSGVSLEGKKQFKDFNPFEILQISSAFARKSLPVSFVLNVDAKNPNDGTGGYPREDITLQSFPWKLYIDGKETVAGNIEAPLVVPGKGEVTVIPLPIQIDLFKFFGNQEYKDLINLALAIAGNKGASAKLELYARPTLGTVLGNITYPGELKIVGMQFTN